MHLRIPGFTPFPSSLCREPSPDAPGFLRCTRRFQPTHIRLAVPAVMTHTEWVTSFSSPAGPHDGSPRAPLRSKSARSTPTPIIHRPLYLETHRPLYLDNNPDRTPPQKDRFGATPAPPPVVEGRAFQAKGPSCFLVSSLSAWSTESIKLAQSPSEKSGQSLTPTVKLAPTSIPPLVHHEHKNNAWDLERAKKGAWGYFFGLTRDNVERVTRIDHDPRNMGGESPLV